MSLSISPPESNGTGVPKRYPSQWSLRRIRRDPVEFLASVGQRGDVAQFTIGGHNAFLLSHPRDIERVLTSNETQFVKSPAFARVSRLLGSGLLTAQGSLHRERRRILQPAFRHDRLVANLAPIIGLVAEACAGWGHGAQLDIASDMQSLTMRIAARTLFGAELHETTIVRDAVIAATACLDPLFTPVSPLRKLADARKTLRKTVESLIRQRAETGECAVDMLSMLMQAEEVPGECSEQMLDDALTLFLAAHDTISHALTWTWTLLAQNPASQETMHHELHTVLGRRTPVASDISNLRFTRAVFSESLRLFPPAWVLVRRATADHQTEAATIPAGSLVFVSQLLTHRDPRFFADPSRFLPERWLDQDVRRLPKGAYFPFGLGPRSCIGEGLAWFEGVLILATIGRTFTFRPPAGFEIVADARLTLRPAAAVMRVERRLID